MLSLQKEGENIVLRIPPSGMLQEGSDRDREGTKACRKQVY
jgi:hypothetical protein